MPDFMYEAIIDRLINMVEIQQKNLKLLHDTLRLIAEDPHIDREKLLTLSVTNSRGMIEDSDEFISKLLKLWGDYRCQS